MKELKAMTMTELNRECVRLSKMNWKEYTTKGNTQRCQELYAELEKVNAEIARRLA